MCVCTLLSGELNSRLRTFRRHHLLCSFHTYSVQFIFGSISVADKEYETVFRFQFDIYSIPSQNRIAPNALMTRIGFTFIYRQRSKQNQKRIESMSQKVLRPKKEMSRMEPYMCEASLSQADKNKIQMTSLFLSSRYMSGLSQCFIVTNLAARLRNLRV